MARQIERLAAIEEERRDIIFRRLRTQHPDTSEVDQCEQAELTTHLLAGLLRYIAISWARQVENGDNPTTDPRIIGDIVAHTLDTLR